MKNQNLQLGLNQKQVSFQWFIKVTCDKNIHKHLDINFTFVLFLSPDFWTKIHVHIFKVYRNIFFFDIAQVYQNAKNISTFNNDRLAKISLKEGIRLYLRQLWIFMKFSLVGHKEKQTQISQMRPVWFKNQYLKHWIYLGLNTNHWEIHIYFGHEAGYKKILQ